MLSLSEIKNSTMYQFLWKLWNVYSFLSFLLQIIYFVLQKYITMGEILKTVFLFVGFLVVLYGFFSKMQKSEQSKEIIRNNELKNQPDVFKESIVLSFQKILLKDGRYNIKIESKNSPNIAFSQLLEQYTHLIQCNLDIDKYSWHKYHFVLFIETKIKVPSVVQVQIQSTNLELGATCSKEVQGNYSFILHIQGSEEQFLIGKHTIELIGV